MYCFTCKGAGHKFSKFKSCFQGFICPDCYAKLPEPVQRSLIDIEMKDIKKMIHIFHNPTEAYGFSGDKVRFGLNNILITGREISVNEIYDMKLFAVKDKKYDGYRLLCELQLKNVKLNIVQDFFGSPVRITEYTEEKMLQYISRYHSEAYEAFIRLYEKVDNPDKNVAKYKANRYVHISSEHSSYTNRSHTYQEYRSSGQSSHSRSSNTKSSSSSYKSNYGRKYSGSSYSAAQRCAMDLYGLHPGFTKDQLKKIKRELLKKYHPDSNGGIQMDVSVRDILTAYDTLCAML